MYLVRVLTDQPLSRNYSPDNVKALVLYGGDNNGGNNYVLNADHGGVDVYVRKRPAV